MFFRKFWEVDIVLFLGTTVKFIKDILRMKGEQFPVVNISPTTD